MHSDLLTGNSGAGGWTLVVDDDTVGAVVVAATLASTVVVVVLCVAEAAPLTELYNVSSTFKAAKISRAQLDPTYKSTLNRCNIDILSYEMCFEMLPIHLLVVAMDLNRKTVLVLLRSLQFCKPSSSKANFWMAYHDTIYLTIHHLNLIHHSFVFNQFSCAGARTSKHTSHVKTRTHAHVHHSLEFLTPVNGSIPNDAH
jgi:hypothetical protein